MELFTSTRRLDKKNREIRHYTYIAWSVLFVLIFLFIKPLYCDTSVELSTTLKSASDPTVFDYMLGVGFKDRHIDISVQRERKSGRTYNDFDIEFTQHIRKIIVAERWRKISDAHGSFLRLDVRYSPDGNFTAGATISTCDEPVKFVVGYGRSGSLSSVPVIGKYLIGIIGATYEISSDLLTFNFSKFYHEEKLSVNFAIGRLFYLGLDSELSDYSKLNWSFSNSIGINIP